MHLIFHVMADRARARPLPRARAIRIMPACHAALTRAPKSLIFGASGDTHKTCG